MENNSAIAPAKSKVWILWSWQNIASASPALTPPPCLNVMNLSASKPLYLNTPWSVNPTAVEPAPVNMLPTPSVLTISRPICYMSMPLYFSGDVCSLVLITSRGTDGVCDTRPPSPPAAEYLARDANVSAAGIVAPTWVNATT